MYNSTGNGPIPAGYVLAYMHVVALYSTTANNTHFKGRSGSCGLHKLLCAVIANCYVNCNE